VENEKCGLVIPYTKEDLKEAIITLKNNPNLCEELGKNAFDAAIRGYNWEKQEEKLLEIYEDLEK
jgi:glycosyltransferase involved in cell wall biosynthesis